MVLQGREVSGADLGLIRDLLAEQPAWGRTRLSEELCRRWDWRNAQGRAKESPSRRASTNSRFAPALASGSSFAAAPPA